MSELKFSCPACGQHIMCSKAYGGNVIQCPNCKAELRIPFSNVTANGDFAESKAERITDNSNHDTHSGAVSKTDHDPHGTEWIEREQKIAAERAARSVSLYPQMKPRLNLALRGATSDESKHKPEDQPENWT